MQSRASWKGRQMYDVILLVCMFMAIGCLGLSLYFAYTVRRIRDEVSDIRWHRSRREFPPIKSARVVGRVTDDVYS